MLVTTLGELIDALEAIRDDADSATTFRFEPWVGPNSVAVDVRYDSINDVVILKHAEF